MPNKNGKSLANRLAAVANRQHEEKMWKKNRRSLNPTVVAAGIKTANEYNKWLKTPAGEEFLNPKPRNVEAFYQTMTRNNTAKKKKNCGPKPPQFIGTKKNPTFNTWKMCSSAAAGGRRKTRKANK